MNLGYFLEKQKLVWPGKKKVFLWKTKNDKNIWVWNLKRAKKGQFWAILKIFFFWLWFAYSKLPLPRTAGFCVRKPLPVSFGRGAIRENPGYRDFKNFFTAEFSHFLVTICFTGVLIGRSHTWKTWVPGFQIPVLEKKSWVPGLKNPGTGKKFWVSGFQNHGTGKKSWVPGFQIQYWKPCREPL